MKPFPAELHGQYDLVHARLLILALRSVDWTLLVANVRILLRLGCYIFWEDDDLENFKGFPATSNRQRILWPRQSASRCPLGGASGPPYPIGLDRLMTASGFANAHQESIRTSDIWDHPTLSWPTQRMMSTSLTAYLKGIVELGGFADLQTTKDAARKIADLTEETEAGKAILNVWYWRTIAQRPVEGAEGR